MTAVTGATGPSAVAAARTIRSLDGAYRAPRALRGPHVQSVLASLQPRRYFVARRARALLSASEPVVVDCGDDVRLGGYYAANAAARSLAVLLHGWEGGADSSYVLSAGAHLYARGHAVLRLNLRDHGDTYHLNPGIFHSCRLAEVVGAVTTIRERYAPERLVLGGFSLGGNFALRVAASARHGVVDRAAAICPVLDPAHTMRVLDEGPLLYRSYFIRKWRYSLGRKARLFPERYDFSALGRRANLEQMTRFLVEAYTEFESLEQYLRGYAITGDRLSSLSVRSSILASLDDPIIPAADLARLHGNHVLDVAVTARGGHCGFVESLSGPSFADRFLGEVLTAE